MIIWRRKLDIYGRKIDKRRKKRRRKRLKNDEKNRNKGGKGEEWVKIEK